MVVGEAAPSQLLRVCGLQGDEAEQDSLAGGSLTQAASPEASSAASHEETDDSQEEQVCHDGCRYNDVCACQGVRCLSSAWRIKFAPEGLCASLHYNYDCPSSVSSPIMIAGTYHCTAMCNRQSNYKVHH